MRKRTAIISIVVALILGAAIGGSGKSDATPAPKVETRTVTKTVDKPVTPQACKDLISIDADLFSTISSALSQWPATDPLLTATQHIKDQTPIRQAQVRDCEAN